MLSFYGFEWNGERIVRAPSFAQRSSNWLRPGNHNHLRLTRILRSLYILGEARAARVLFSALSDVYEDELRNGRKRIPDGSFRFWKDACEPRPIP